MRYVLNLIYFAALIIFSPVAIYRMIRQNRYRKGWRNRVGIIENPGQKAKCVWIHAVSVGEVNATRTIVGELEAKLNDCQIAISTTTDTGFERANKLYGGRHLVFFFPMDFSFVMEKAFKNLDPDCCVLMELEVWPNFVMTAKRLGIPVVVANGRISEKSYKRYKQIKPIARWMFDKVSLILSQTEEYRQRFIELGVEADNVITTNSLKYDTAQTNANVEGADELRELLKVEGQRLWVAGGTGNDEEPIILDVFRELKKLDEFEDLRLALVPRKPERFDEVNLYIRQFGFESIRLGRLKSGTAQAVDGAESVILGDTMGDLRKFYSFADMIFVGRSLVKMGGSDMMEAAALEKCTIFGPYAFNFKQTVEALVSGDGAIMVQDEHSLFEVMKKCLSDDEYRNGIATRGKEIIVSNQGATQKTVEHIERLVNQG